MDKPSFNLVMSNLAIGLFKNHPGLNPLARELGNLGYELFSVEASFTLPSSSKIQPEIIAISSSTNHSMICEWTATNYVSNKEAQLNRYLELDQSSLTSHVQIPRRSTEKHSIWLVVSDQTSDQFIQFLHEKYSSEIADRLSLSTLEFLSDGSYKLSFRTGKMQSESELSLFKQSYVFEKIPLGYLRIVTSDLGISEICDIVLTTFLSLCIRNSDSEISCQLIASKLFSVWEYFDNDGKLQVINAIDKVLKDFANQHGRRFIQRGPRRSWKLSDARLDTTRLKSLKVAIEKYRNEVTSAVKQLTIVESEGDVISLQVP